VPQASHAETERFGPFGPKQKKIPGAENLDFCEIFEIFGKISENMKFCAWSDNGPCDTRNFGARPMWGARLGSGLRERATGGANKFAVPQKKTACPTCPLGAL